MLNYWTAGNRSSVDASNVGGNEEDETVVEPEQGNGKHMPSKLVTKKKTGI